MLSKALNYKKTFAFILGGLLTIALPSQHNGNIYNILRVIILFMSFGGFIFMLQAAKGYKNAFALGFWFGFGYFSIGLSWINNALAIDLPRLGWLIPIAFASSGGFFGLFVGIPSVVSFYFKNIYAKILAFASLWVIFEWIRSFIFTGFPWNLLGYSLSFCPKLIQIASIIGSYGVSLLVIITTSLAVVPIIKRTKKDIIISVGTVFLIIATIFVYGDIRLKNISPEKNSQIKVSVVQPSIPQNLKWDKDTLKNNQQTYIDYSVKSHNQDKKHLIIWGETANPYIPEFDAKDFADIYRAVPANGYLITGTISYIYDQKLYPQNSMLAIDSNHHVAAKYSKSHLVPFGEYIPLRKYLPDSLRPVTNVISDFRAGNGVETLSLKDVPNFGVLICYEIIFPAEIVDKNNRPMWLINLTNDGWYGTGAGPYQHLAIAQMRAVEEGLTIVRAANSGISAIISKTGTILDSIPLNYSGVLDFYLPQELAVITFCAKHKNKIPLTMCIILFLLAISINYKYNNKQNKKS